MKDFWAIFARAVCIGALFAAVAHTAEPVIPGREVEIRYVYRDDYVRELSTAVYRKTGNPKFLPPAPNPGMIWEPRPAAIIEEFTGVKRPEGAQVYYIAGSGTLIVRGDRAWQKLHCERP
jgi:hypothetical protein